MNSGKHIIQVSFTQSPIKQQPRHMPTNYHTIFQLNLRNDDFTTIDLHLFYPTQKLAFHRTPRLTLKKPQTPKEGKHIPYYILTLQSCHPILPSHSTISKIKSLNNPSLTLLPPYHESNIHIYTFITKNHLAHPPSNLSLTYPPKFINFDAT